MKKAKKRLLGLFSLVIVVVMTIVAYYLPTPNAAAESVTQTIQVVVYDQYPSVVVESPESGAVTTDPSIDVGVKYENSSVVKFTLKYYKLNETTGEEEVVEIPLPDFTPSELDPVFNYASGETTYTIDLAAIASEAGYNHFYLHVESSSPVGHDEDEIEFFYIPAAITQTGVNEDGDPTAEVEFAEGVSEVSYDIYDENGNKLNSEPIVVKNDADENGEYPAGTKTITIPLGSYGAATGTYRLLLTAYDEENEEINAPYDEIFNGEYDALRLNYTAPEAPEVPNTGRFLSSLNISTSDYMITGVIVFATAAVIALMIVGKKQKKNYRKNYKSRR
ncbi:hypothetical protein IJI70_03000 [Candidatus Saccharibacteria bacterium]|nr:hypothetical protein [Candidatus Saccharibacteria bacterium]